MNPILSILDVREGLKVCIFSALFEKNSIFKGNAPPEDDITDGILTLSTQDSEFSNCFLKILLGTWQTKPQFSGC